MRDINNRRATNYQVRVGMFTQNRLRRYDVDACNAIAILAP